MNTTPLFSSDMKKSVALILFLVMQSASIYSQTDSLIFNSGDIIVGEAKEMNQGILKMSTDYSDSDFTIEWDKIVGFHSDQFYTIALKDKSIFTSATLKTVGPSTLQITSPNGNMQIAITDIVYLRELDSGFWSKLSASLDIGFSLTKANDLRQYNARAGLGYKTDKWIISGTYSQVKSEQDDAAATERTDASIGANYQLKNSFFVGTSVNFLSNTEQLLDLRTTSQLGLGYYIVRSGNLYWSGFTGLSFNNEDYASNAENPDVSNDRQSMEGVIGMEVNLFDVGDLSLFSNIYWYPSFTEEGRHRADYRFDIKYDLPLDFYIKAGLTFNYDNKPVDGASESDYVVQTGFGWEL